MALGTHEQLRLGLLFMSNGLSSFADGAFAGFTISNVRYCDSNPLPDNNGIMQTISAAHSTFVKRVLPFVVVGGACAWVYWSRRDQPQSLEIGLFWLVISTVIMAVALRRSLWRMADTVEDYGDRLVITRWKTRVEIPIWNVREIKRERQLVGSEVTILLDGPSALGSEVTFLAPDKRKSPGIDEALEALARRVASQGRSRDA
jgi:hypothetical protein